eukprot:jgi/Mesen1/7068/ME000369S06392
MSAERDKIDAMLEKDKASPEEAEMARERRVKISKSLCTKEKNLVASAVGVTKGTLAWSKGQMRQVDLVEQQALDVAPAAVDAEGPPRGDGAPKAGPSPHKKKEKKGKGKSKSCSKGRGKKGKGKKGKGRGCASSSDSNSTPSSPAPSSETTSVTASTPFPTGGSPLGAQQSMQATGTPPILLLPPQSHLLRGAKGRRLYADEQPTSPPPASGGSTVTFTTPGPSSDTTVAAAPPAAATGDPQERVHPPTAATPSVAGSSLTPPGSTRVPEAATAADYFVSDSTEDARAVMRNWRKQFDMMVSAKEASWSNTPYPAASSSLKECLEFAASSLVLRCDRHAKKQKTEVALDALDMLPAEQREEIVQNLRSETLLLAEKSAHLRALAEAGGFQLLYQFWALRKAEGKLKPEQVVRGPLPMDHKTFKLYMVWLRDKLGQDYTWSTVLKYSYQTLAYLVRGKTFEPGKYIEGSVAAFKEMFKKQLEFIMQ